MIARICPECGNEFTVDKPSDPKRFCGRSCASHELQRKSSRARQIREARHREATISEIRWLLDSGEENEQIAHRLGYQSLHNLYNSLRTWGRLDLVDQLTGRETCGHIPRGVIRWAA